MYVAVLRYGDESSADDKDDEVKEPDHRDESLQSLVENTRFFYHKPTSCSSYLFFWQKNVSA